MDYLLKNEKELIKNSELINANSNYNEFDLIMSIYQSALNDMVQKFINLKQLLNEYYQYDVITNVTSRIKRKDSIIKKMKNKKIDISYDNMIENINDIAGIRVVCNYTDDIYKIVDIIRKQNDIKVLKEKDYIKSPKDSGYSAYHMILEVPIEINKDEIYVKIEIQIRTVLMDFWSTTEHKVKYKPSKKISNIDSIRLCIYAKVVNMISDKMMKIYRK